MNEDEFLRSLQVGDTVGETSLMRQMFSAGSHQGVTGNNPDGDPYVMCGFDVEDDAGEGLPVHPGERPRTDDDTPPPPPTRPYTEGYGTGTVRTEGDKVVGFNTLFLTEAGSRYEIWVAGQRRRIKSTPTNTISYVTEAFSPDLPDGTAYLLAGPV